MGLAAIQRGEEIALRIEDRELALDRQRDERRGWTRTDTRGAQATSTPITAIVRTFLAKSRRAMLAASCVCFR